MAIKVMLVGFENTGKSTLISKIEDALVINCDTKEYAFKVPHANYKEYKSVEDFTNFINSKVKAYKEKFKKLPKYVVIDTITHLYTLMQRTNKKFLKGFDLHRQIGDDTLDIIDYINKTLLTNGINCIIAAHTLVEFKTERFTVPSSGQFKSAGGWISTVGESFFIEKNEDKHVVVLKKQGNDAVRTNLKFEEDIVEIPINEFDINKHLEQITQLSVESKEMEL